MAVFESHDKASSRSLPSPKQRMGTFLSRQSNSELPRNCLGGMAEGVMVEEVLGKINAGFCLISYSEYLSTPAMRLRRNINLTHLRPSHIIYLSR